MNYPLKVSVVFSVYNESESLPALFDTISGLVQASRHHFELIFVNDGSTDNSGAIIGEFRGRFLSLNATVRYLQLSRNFGHEAAMIAGIDHATGDAVICLDADLQHPPELIPQMLEHFEKGCDIVTMVRRKNAGSSRQGRFFSSLFYCFINQLSPHKLQENASDFFLISKKVAEILKKDFRERNRFLRGIIQTIGFQTATIGFEAPTRQAGKSKYPFFRLLSLTSAAISSFSKAPLFLGIWFGFFFALISFLLGFYTLWVYLFGQTPPSGYTTIVLFMSVSFMILFFLIGIIGIYVGYLFDEQKNRPLYIVEINE